MTKYIPFEEIQIIFHTKKAEMEAIIASLPSSPYLLKPPLLLSIMTGEKWNSPNIISHHVLRIYIAAIFYIESIRKDPMSNHFLMVKETLKAEQKDIFAQYAEDESKFLLQYIHAYERALIKYLHLFKVGEDVCLEPNEQGEPPISYFILKMNAETIKELEFHELITTKLWKDPLNKKLNDYSEELDQLQQQLELNLHL